MTQFIVTIPTNKIKQFFTSVLAMGIVPKVLSKKQSLNQVSIPDSLKKITQSFILFEWEFYSNELEYE